MGLLDDAIREHLDLKRRRGADPSEIERAEREALGPVRREPEPIPSEGYEESHVEPGYGDEPEPAFGHEPDFAAEPAHEAREDAPFYDDEIDAPFEAPPLGSVPPEPMSEPLPHEPPLTHGAVGIGPEQPAYDEPLGAHEDDPWVSEPGAPEGTGRDHVPEPEPPAASLDQETVEYRLEQHEHEHEHEQLEPEPHPAEPQGEDMLQETPEFLQDTPEHDRLWFEQRPPRNFDFDK